MLKNIGAPELIIVLALLILFFGGKKIPEFIRSLTESVREFKKGAGDTSSDQKS